MNLLSGYKTCLTEGSARQVLYPEECKKSTGACSDRLKADQIRWGWQKQSVFSEFRAFMIFSELTLYVFQSGQRSAGAVWKPGRAFRLCGPPPHRSSREGDLR